MKRALEGQTTNFICLSPSLVPFGSSLSPFFKYFLMAIALVKLFQFMFDGNETGNNKSTAPLDSKVIKGLLISCRKLAETHSLVIQLCIRYCVFYLLFPQSQILKHYFILRRSSFPISLAHFCGFTQQQFMYSSWAI